MALAHRQRSPSFASTGLARTVGAALLAGAMLATGCARRPASAPPAPSRPTTEPAPDTAPTAAETATRRGDFAYAPGTYRYEVTSEASVELRDDSAGTQPAHSASSGIPLIDTVTTAVHLTYQISPAAADPATGGEQQQVAGSVDSFTVRSAGLVPAGRRTLPAPLPFRATLAGSRTPVQFEARPDTACAAPDAALLAVARDLLVPLPLSLAPGSEWRDTVTTTMCRADIPVTTQSVHSYRVVGPAERDGAQALRVTRETTVTLQGQAFPREQMVTITGGGQGTGELFLDLTTGRYLGGASESQVELTVSNGVQVKKFVQHARQTTSPRQ
jgi:hypothetical protein